jgi:23S rRNA (cytidine1920-2'-O)/16S rRNA (cytidine1409-2'-O)-methyltransferase
MPRKNRPRFVALIERVHHTHPAVTDPVPLIRSARVMVNGVIITNPGARVPADSAARLRQPTQPRGRIKLAAALHAFEVPVQGRTAIDIGASTGGFTLALLHAGARRVYAVDAGHGQLLGSLRRDPRVVNLENTNLGDLHPRLVPESVEVITADLSYLALAQAGPQFEVLDIAVQADLVVLVKPMYELGLAVPPREGALHVEAVNVAVSGLERCGWKVHHTMESPIRGGRGAVEFLAHLRRCVKYRDG